MRPRLWLRVIIALVLICVLPDVVGASPGPLPTTAAPDEEEVRPASIVILAAGRTFRWRGVILQKEGAGLIPADDAQTRALFQLYSARVTWKGDGLLVTLDDRNFVLRDHDRDVLAGDLPAIKLDVPLVVIEGVPYLPVGALPLLLPGKLQGIQAGGYTFDPVVTSIDLEPQEGGGVCLTLEARVPMVHTSFMLRKPNRYVLNIPNVVLDLERYRHVNDRRLQHPEIGEIRFDQFSYRPNLVRVVIPLRDDQELHVLPRSTPRKMLVTINKPSVQSHSDEMSTRQISDVRIERSDGTVRLILKASGPFQYEWHRLRPPDNRFFLDIPKAVLQGPRRQIDFGDAWLDDVQIGQFQKEPVPTVRVLLNLERAADTRILSPRKSPNTLVLEVRHKTISDYSTGLSGVGVCGAPFEGAPGVSSPEMHARRHTGRVICIDPGHGGSDPGASNQQLGIREKDVTLDVALRLRRILTARGWHVVMTRTTDRDVTYPGSSASEELSARVRVAEAFHTSLFVSVHCNSSANQGANGTSTHYYKTVDRFLASALHPHVIEALGCPDRGIVRNRFYVLAHCRLPAVLIESAFISNASDGRKLADPDHRQRLAEGIADGLQRYVARTFPGTGMNVR